MSPPRLVAIPTVPANLKDARFDAVVLVASALRADLPLIGEPLSRALALDARVAHAVSLVPAPVSGGRLIVSPTGPLDRDYDDVRRVAAAASVGVTRARDAGAVAPLLVLSVDSAEPQLEEVALLGALSGLWQPLEAREAHGDSAVEPVHTIGFASKRAQAVLARVSALEAGRRLARDLTGTEPERMRPEAFAADCVDAFSGSPVQLRVVDDLDTLAYQYPLMMAVARASLAVERHRPRVIHLDYSPEGPIERTIFLAGKGVTYDTGGSDLKVGGIMAGMSRDKGGAAAVAGVFRALSELRPSGVRVAGALGVLRNSTGPDAYVSDEILTGHSGVRVRVGNTDAEGRLVLADLLSHLRVAASDATQPCLLSLATLTGHAGRAVGPYPILLDNGPARAQRVADELSALGERWGDPFELSRLRREDYDFIKPRTLADDVLSANPLPSSVTARGHQYPTAFLDVASGLSKHGRDSVSPLAFTHMDLAGSAFERGDWQHGRPTASGVVPLTLWIAERA